MHRLAWLGVPVALLGCGREPVAPATADAPLFAESGIQRPVNWAVMDLTCPDGALRANAQWQSITPLDEDGDLVLVGGNDPLPPRGCVGREDWFVYDVSSGQAVLLDALDTPSGGFRLGAHSPRGSSVGFGVQRSMLVIYDGGFRTVSLPMSGLGPLGVWAASPADAWIGGDGKILRYDGATGFVEEWVGEDLVHSLWGHGPTARFAVTFTGMLQRNSDETWTPVELPTECDDTHPLGVPFGIAGISPADVWAIGREGSARCLLHYDGRQWSSVAPPAGGSSFSSILPLDAMRVLVVGQQAIPTGSELIALWGTTDAGRTWTQLGDPQFTELAAGAARGFFTLSAARGNHRMYLPVISGGKLLLGTPQDLSTLGAYRTLGLSAAPAGGESVAEFVER